MVSVLLSHPWTYSFKAGSLTKSRAKMATKQSQWSSCLHPQRSRVTGTQDHAQLFRNVLVTWSWVFVLAQQMLLQIQVISLTPLCTSQRARYRKLCILSFPNWEMSNLPSAWRQLWLSVPTEQLYKPCHSRDNHSNVFISTNTNSSQEFQAFFLWATTWYNF